MSTLRIFFVTPVMVTPKPSSGDKQKGTACISNQIVDVQITSRHKRLVELIKEAIGEPEYECAEKGAVPHHRENTLVIKRPPYEPAEDEEENCVDDLVSTGWSVEVQPDAWCRREDISDDNPDYGGNLVSQEILQLLSIRRNAGGS